ncbi:MAG: TRAP transporter substrate-binding protein DctP, partial [Acidobacteriota bacterium]|nr:TRAP transporter substrate-binding protein DctP [Acidobacteriota bacterium]
GTTIRLATLIPDGSIWDKALKQMGDSWRKASEGRVSLRVYPGGVQGDETDVLRKMRIGSLQAGTLTIAGLAEIDPAFNVLAIPLFFESYDELFHVLGELRPELEKRLEDKGYVLVQWGYAGWVHFFSKRPIHTPDDLKQAKIFVWHGEDQWIGWWRSLGYQPVPLAATDILTGLKTGMVDTIRTTPLAALSLQWFRETPHMHDLGLGPLTGATIVSAKTWSKIDESDQVKLLEAAREMELELQAEIPGEDKKAVDLMNERGLEVTVTENPEGWRRLAEDFVQKMRGDSVPENIFDRAIAIRDAYRRDLGKQAAAGGSS